MRLGVITDTHLAPVGTPSISWHSPLLFDDAGERYARGLRTLEERGAEAIVVLGDLTHFGDEASFDDFLGLSAAVGVPLIAITGNHDVVPELEGFARGLARTATGVIRAEGPEPAAVIGGIPLLGVGVEATTLADGTAPDELERYRTTGHPVVTGPSIVLSHYPVLSLEQRCADLGVRYAGDLIDRAELERAVRGDDFPTVVLNGHLHLRAAQTSGTLFQFTFGALIESPFDVAMLELDLQPGRGELRIEQLGPLVESPVALAPRDVAYRFDGAAWTPAR
jgi:hypothetical protein